MTQKTKYKVGQKVLFRIPGYPAQVSILQKGNFNSCCDFHVDLSGTFIGTGIYEHEILRVISDKPLCKYGKLIPGAV